MSKNDPAERAVRDIRRKTRKQYSAEEKIRIVVSGLRGEDSIAELCRREGIAESLYYSWSKEFLEAGKKRLSGDTARQASSGEVKDLRREMHDFKEALRLTRCSHERIAEFKCLLDGLPPDLGAMSIGRLEGYAAGTLVCPGTIPPSQWLPVVWAMARPPLGAPGRQG